MAGNNKKQQTASCGTQECDYPFVKSSKITVDN